MKLPALTGRSGLGIMPTIRGSNRLRKEAVLERYPIERCTTAETIEMARAIRRTVFVSEQHINPAIEDDGMDAEAVHFLAFADGEAAGTVRLIPMGDEIKLGRMAVKPLFRRQGIGRQMVKYVLEYAREQGISAVVLNAQASARAFYFAMGFVEEGEPFLEAGIPHQRMRLRVYPK